MKWLQFLILLLRKGSLHHTPRDFEGSRRELLRRGNLPVPAESVEGLSTTKSYKNSPLGYMVAANLAYLRDAAGMNKMYFISDRHQLVYVRLLKCASTSMLKVFMPLIDQDYRGLDLDEEQLDALAYYVRRKSLLSKHRGYTKFALVRNPFRRIVSAYLDLFDPKADPFTYSTYAFGILRKDMTFKDLVRILHKIPRWFLGPHFAPQWYILSQSSTQGVVDTFCLEKDVDRLRQFLEPYGVVLPHVNRTYRDHDYRSFYDAETFEWVRQVYILDITSFGYDEDCLALERFVQGDTQENLMR